MFNFRVLCLSALFCASATLGVYALPGSPSSSAVFRWTGSDQPPTIPVIPVRSAGYTDGTFVGRREFAYYGTVQVEAVIHGGNIVDVRFLLYPNDNGTSRYINGVALPALRREAIRVQGSHVRFVSGATFTSEAFHLSLHTALVKAVN